MMGLQGNRKVRWH